MSCGYVDDSSTVNDAAFSASARLAINAFSPYFHAQELTVRSCKFNKIKFNIMLHV